MKEFKIVPKIIMADTFGQFISEFNLGEGDVIITSKYIYKPFIEPLGLQVPVIIKSNYGNSEPTDEMIDLMGKDLQQYNCKRIIAIGGGSIIDICKVLALDLPDKSEKLFTGEHAPKKLRQLVAIPTTCGTGSEVTNVSIAEIKSLKTKKGIAVEETYADVAVLIPELLEVLPDYSFSTSAIDALIHSLESDLSPKATEFSKIYSKKALTMLVEGFKKIVEAGNTIENRKPYLKDFALAATYAGVAFGNAGCGAVHALSYSIGGAFHVPHGEANYQFFTEVFRLYTKKKPEGSIEEVNSLLAGILECKVEEVYEKVEELLNSLIPKKKLRDYGMVEEQIEEFTKLTIDNQQRLLANNYVFLDEDEIRGIFRNLY